MERWVHVVPIALLTDLVNLRLPLRRMHVHVIKRERRLKAQAPLLLCYSRAHHSIHSQKLGSVSISNTVLVLNERDAVTAYCKNSCICVDG